MKAIYLHQSNDHLELKILTWIICTVLIGIFLSMLIIGDNDKMKSRRVREPQRKVKLVRRRIKEEEREVCYE